ncbi:MAG: indole-3-glycerol phosphate synthase TrpC [Eubacteriales bacterium]|nr:indole-3-glycerol phosphate synthase TrpC [Eubacteriales bacterium]MDD3349873.1 indole-3-glycerol phosphate synthase TrpC [Eubacteriales bacterium]
MILEQIIEKRKQQLTMEIARTARVEIERAARFSNRPVLNFQEAIKADRLCVIAEVKKASPSKGLIKLDFDPVRIAVTYENAGANAVSVLTEEYYFQGAGSYLKQIREAINLPLLRKDFIIDPYQIYEARVLGADAILLIVSLLPEETLREFLSLAEFLSLSCLVEVHNEAELEIALSCNAKIIGINNRDLKSFEVSLETTKKLACLIPKDCIIVSESGFSLASDFREARAYGADAILIGETLMRSDDIGETLSVLRKGV